VKSRSQNPEFRSQEKRKTKSVKVASALLFWLLASDSWLLLFTKGRLENG
jgi:hypothetical protein